jgi:endogenous inhibitor of DNA gyrase (YacG/DUF329 family)
MQCAKCGTPVAIEPDELLADTILIVLCPQCALPLPDGEYEFSGVCDGDDRYTGVRRQN